MRGGRRLSGLEVLQVLFAALQREDNRGDDSANATSAFRCSPQRRVARRTQQQGCADHDDDADPDSGCSMSHQARHVATDGGHEKLITS